MDSSDVIKEYLLRRLPESEREQFEERLLLDRDFFEQVMIVEDELIDAYLEGSLTEEQRFEIIRHFFSTPQQRQKLRIMAAFKEYVSKSGPEELLYATDHGHKLNSLLSRGFIAIHRRIIAAV